MKKIIIIASLSLFFQTLHGQQALYKILKEYLPYVPFEKKVDSLFSFYTSNKDFIADTTGLKYLKGDLKNFNPPELKPNKIVIEVELKESSLYYVVRFCLDTSIASKRIVETEVEKMHKRVSRYFERTIGDESGKKEERPYKIYNLYSPGDRSPSMLIEWGYNQSAKFTGYYWAITLLTKIEE